MSLGARSSSRTFTAPLRSGATLLRSSSRSAPVLRGSRMARRYPAPVDGSPVHRWAASGAMTLTGLPDLPLGPPSGLVQGIDRLARSLPRTGRVGPAGRARRADGSLAPRHHQLWRKLSPAPCGAGLGGGVTAAGGRHGGRPGLARARPVAPATAPETWSAVAHALVRRDADELMPRAALLGLPVARVGEATGSPAVARVQLGSGPARRPGRLPGRRPLRAVGGPPLRRPVGRRGGDRAQGGVNDTP